MLDAGGLGRQNLSADAVVGEARAVQLQHLHLAALGDLRGPAMG